MNNLPRGEAGSLARRVGRRFLRHQMAVAAMVVLLLLALGVLLVGVLSPYDPEASSLSERREPPGWVHPMGTDSLGRDILTRLLYGGRVSLTIGLAATALGVVVGAGVGAVAGYYGGAVDNALMRLADLFLALPRLFMLIVMALLMRTLDASLLTAGGGVGGIALILGLLSWMGIARIVRGQVLSLAAMDFVVAARSLGVSGRGIILRHILPNTLTPIIVAATLGVAGAIIAESGLSFLGFGIQPPAPTWGNMLNGAQDEMRKGNWWMALFPGLMIFATVIAINYIGDGLRDALDPRRER
jgi:peptide/nickel transport system permease protein